MREVHNCISPVWECVPVSGDRDVGGEEGLSFCLWYIPPLGCLEADGQFALFNWVLGIQLHEATRQLSIHAWAASWTGPLQDPWGTGVLLLPQNILVN